MAKEKLDPINLALRNAAILQAHLAGKSTKEIAAEYEIHPGQVNRILSQEKAKHPPGGWGATPAPTKGKRPDEKKAAKRSVAPRVRQSQRRRVARKSNGKPGALEATILMLRRMPEETALHPKEIVERLAEKKMWKSPSGGRTPFATLWSNLLAEIKKGPRVSRVRLVSPGRFGLTKVGRAG